MNEQSDTELIELYLDGSLAGRELEQFNHRLTEDERFRADVTLQRALVKNIFRQGRRELQLQLKTYHQRIAETNADIGPGKIINERQSFAPRLNKKLVSLMAAASVVIVMMVAGIQFYIHLSAENIYTRQFVPYSISTSRGGPNTPNEIVSLYRSGNYTEYISAYRTKPQRSLQEIFLMGNAYLINGETDKAINTFKNVIEQDEKLAVENQQYYEDAEYFLALAYLKNNELQKAELLFRKIVSTPQHSYHHEVGDWFMLKLRLLRTFG